MEDKQLASQRSTQTASATNNPENNPSKIPPSSGSRVKNNNDGLVLQELLDIFRRVTDDKPEKSRFNQFLTHPITLLVLGFMFSFGVGSWLTYYYARKAQEVAATRSFSDELNKLRIQKVGAVWERLDQDQVNIEQLVNELNDNNADDKTARNAVLQQIEKLIDTDKGVIAQHRFWLSQETYDKMHKYLDATIFLLTRQILSPEADIEPLKKARDDARSDIETERAKFLSSETIGVPGRCYLF